MRSRQTTFLLALIMAGATSATAHAQNANYGRRMSDAAISKYLTFGPPRSGVYATYGYQPGWYGGYSAYGPGGWRRRNYYDRTRARYNEAGANYQGYGAYNTGDFSGGFIKSGDWNEFQPGTIPRQGGMFDR